MKNLQELKGFIDRVNATERWDDIPESDWNEACYFAGVEREDCE